MGRLRKSMRVRLPFRKKDVDPEFETIEPEEAEAGIEDASADLEGSGAKRRFAVGALVPRPKLRREKKSQDSTADTSTTESMDFAYMRAFNLLPGDEPVEEREPRANTAQLVLAVVALVSLAGLAAAFLIMNASVADKEAERDDLEAQLAAVETIIQEAEDQAEPIDPLAISETNDRTDALGAALGERIAWDRVLRDVSLVMPEGVWLTGMIGAPGEEPVAPPAPPTEEGEEPPPEPARPLSSLTLNGFSFGHAGIAELISRLSTIPELTQVTLVSSVAVDIEEEDVLQFSVVARVKAPGGSTT